MKLKSLTRLLIAISFYHVSSLEAQEPGRTHVALDVLVANSAEIFVVQVQSFEPKEDTDGLMGLNLKIIQQLKLPMTLSKDLHPQPNPSLLQFDASECKKIQQQNQLRWGDGLTLPSGNGPLATFQKSQDDGQRLLLFRNLIANEKTIDYIVNLALPVRMGDLKSLHSEERILSKTGDLINHYRGVEHIKTVVIQAQHWAHLLKGLSIDGKTARPFERQDIIVANDSKFERLLQIYLKNPAGLQADQYTTVQVDWLENARRFYHFRSEENAQQIRIWLRDSKIGTSQKQLLQQILKKWNLPDSHTD